ncbi:MAG: decarboxylating 6-phosphogluconate dehydrogenase [Nitrospirae bacterium]|nr:decarboxylating 6-phosphogluconate dehydrogenase [Nitrospirota bacterium]
MQMGMIGLGRMGANMSQRLLKSGHQVIGYDRSSSVGKELIPLGGARVYSTKELVEKLTPPRVIWMMVPAGSPVDQTVEELLPHLSSGDTLIDGGNSYYQDALRRSKALESREIHWLDVGTSGGIWGLKEGYCLMVGGREESFVRCEPLFKSLAPEGGYLYSGSSGAGHFTKMVHNGIEYGMLQAYAEGFELLKRSSFKFDLESIARLWQKGSVVRSWLLELTASALKKDSDLSKVKGFVEDSGEGRWIVKEGVDCGVPLPVITQSLFARFQSRQEESFSAKMIAALRKEFGGHEVKKTDE